MRFATRLALSMLAVVLVATALGLLASAAQMRAAYGDTLHDLFTAGVRVVTAVRDGQLGAVKARTLRMAGSPRLFAARQSGDPELLTQVADDELRDFFLRDRERMVGGRPSEGFVFLDEAGAPMAPGTGKPGLDAAVAARWRREPDDARSSGAQRLGYLEFEDRAYEVLFTPITDPDDGAVEGMMALLFLYEAAPPSPSASGGELRNGLLIGNRIFGGQLPPGAAAAIGAANTAAMPSRDGASEIPFELDGEDWIAHRQPVDATDPSVQLVIAASLEPMQAALRRLVISAIAAGSLGVALGVVVALFTARGLARPVAALSAAAHRIGTGDYGVRLTVKRRDELGLLAERFNEMTHGLSLRDRYRGLLDLVADPGIAEEMIGGSVALGGVSTPAAVLFCDIRGFTPLSNRLGADEVVRLLNEHMTALTEVVYRHGGVVDKFVGDLIMAVFGAPRAGTDDAARAARCALDMVATRARMNRDAKEPIEIGVGVAFGDMIAGCMGSSQRLNYTVLGERVNLAARLCSVAPAMGVFVDATVAERLGEDWRVTRLEPLKVKGFAEPVTAFRLDLKETET